jgi:hypothetical protein
VIGGERERRSHRAVTRIYYPPDTKSILHIAELDNSSMLFLKRAQPVSEKALLAGL